MATIFKMDWLRESSLPAPPSTLLSHFDVCGLVLEVADPPAVAEFTTALRSKHFSQLDLQTFGLAGKGLDVDAAGKGLDVDVPIHHRPTRPVAPHHEWPRVLHVQPPARRALRH